MDVQNHHRPPNAWLNWGQPVEPLGDLLPLDTVGTQALRMDSPVLPEDRNQLRSRLLQMIVASEQSRKAHSHAR